MIVCNRVRESRLPPGHLQQRKARSRKRSGFFVLGLRDARTAASVSPITDRLDGGAPTGWMEEPRHAASHAPPRILNSHAIQLGGLRIFLPADRLDRLPPLPAPTLGARRHCLARPRIDLLLRLLESGLRAAAGGVDSVQLRRRPAAGQGSLERRG